MCQITFQVMDINPAYITLLGQPWIRSVGVVPSTLHQKLKFVVEGQLIIVSGEEDILVSCPSSTPYVETVEEPGARDRARLQNGVWWQVRNSSFFHERTE